MIASSPVLPRFVLGVAVLIVAALTILFASTDARPPGRIIWRDRFEGGRIASRDWTRCAQPWSDLALGCSSAHAGGDEYVYWSPKVFGAAEVGDTVVLGMRHGVRLRATRLTPGEAARVRTAIPRGSDTRETALLRNARWKSAWLQTRKSWGINHRIAATFLPSTDPSAWFGLWMLNDPAHRRWPPEIDVAEVTNLPDGRFYVRQNVHWTDAAGKHQVDTCPATLDKNTQITAGVTRSATTLTFDLNGHTTCSFPLRRGVADPMQAIVSLQVGGLGKPSTSATPAIEVGLEEIRVEQTESLLPR